MGSEVTRFDEASKMKLILSTEMEKHLMIANGEFTDEIQYWQVRYKWENIVYRISEKKNVDVLLVSVEVSSMFNTCIERPSEC